MNKTLLLLTITTLTIITSCNKKQKYNYIEIGIRNSALEGRKPYKNIEEILTESDSIAYLKAFFKFCTSKKADIRIKKATGATLKTPTDFKLINKDGVDIARNITFEKIDSLKASIENRIFSLKDPS